MARKTPQIDDPREWIAKNALTTSEAAEYLGVTRQAIFNAVKRGILAPVKAGIFYAADLDDYNAKTIRTRPRAH
jgi:excisionase family DNA binding protein